MPSVLSVAASFLFLLPAVAAFTWSKPAMFQSKALNMVAVAAAEKTMQVLESPDFYWEYRLERLASKFGSEVKYSPSNYPDVEGFKDLYDAYYLDLTLQG